MKTLKIKKITKLSNKQDRYDLTINETGNFYANSILIHNTSNRFGFTYIENQNPFIKFLSKFLPIKLSKLDYLVGTRRVILEKDKKSTYYGNEEFRYKHFNLVKEKLQPGEIIYCELVGYTSDGKKIMPDHDTSDTKDKEFIKKYGKNIQYTYGCPVGEVECLVYRITKSDEHGNLIDLSWAQIKDRCKELGLKYVVEICPSFIFDGDIRTLQRTVEEFTDGPDLIDNNIHREGLVVRVENGSKIPLLLKNKSWYFGVMEGFIKNNDEYVDMEESS
jgi:hypothetical protein